MSETKIGFLKELGITKGNYPQGFFEKIENMNQCVTNVERGYCADESRCDGREEDFCIKDVVGTDHERYAGNTWIDAFWDLDRGDNIIELYRSNPQYWEEMKKEGHAEIGLLKRGDKYYILARAGGGNNRIITMKIKYLALIHQAGDDEAEIDRINKEFTFKGRVRELPIDINDPIPFVVVAMAEDLSGITVCKKGETFCVTKKFTDIELFRGSSEELIEYFQSLFDIAVHGEKIVNERLQAIERGCHFSARKHRQILESILPQLKEFGER